MVNPTDDPDDIIDYDQYKYSVGMKYDLKTRDLTFKKAKYIMDEVLNDIRWSKRGSFEYQLSIFYIIMLFFLRMFNHYTGQWLACELLGVPVTRFDAYIYKIYVEYAATNFIQEVAVVVGGVLANTAVFGASFILAFLSKTICNCFPRLYYKLICWLGVFAVFDPLIVLVVDVCSQSFTHGDWFKFYNYYAAKEGNGVVGFYITFFIMFALTIFNGFLFYYYMIFVHMNGRILDLYKRLSGTSQTFFLPNDNEVSLSYLQWVMHMTMSSQKQHYIISSDDKTVYDEVGRSHQIQFLQIYKIEGKLITAP